MWVCISEDNLQSQCPLGGAGSLDWSSCSYGGQQVPLPMQPSCQPSEVACEGNLAL